MKHLIKFSAFAGAALFCGVSAFAQAVKPAPDLDLAIQYYSKVLTPEGVLRESRYEETMLRRPAHVWVARVLPKNAQQHDDEHEAVAQRGADKGIKKVAVQAEAHEHKHFNHAVVPRHVTLENNKVRIEFVDAVEKQVVSIPPAEFENVNFDGSWVNAYYLLDPEQLKALPLSTKISTVAGARWREREKNGIYQRVLWDEQKQIPLVVETGDRVGSFYRRIDIKPLATLSKDLPWLKVKGFAQKEYSDFLD